MQVETVLIGRTMTLSPVQAQQRTPEEPIEPILTSMHSSVHCAGMPPPRSSHPLISTLSHLH